MPVVLLALVLASPAGAQLARRGDTVVASDVAATKRLPAVALDPERGVFLVTWSLFPVGGRFLASDGTPLGAPFAIPMRTPASSLAPRVAYAPAIDAFLVAWIEEDGGSRIAARLVRAGAGGAPEFLGDDVIVSATARAKHPESSPSVAWSERSRTFLVTWADTEGDLDVRARRLDEHAVPLGDEFQLSSGEGFDGFPVVALGAARDAFLVAWTHEPPGGSAIAGRTVAAADGALGAEQVLYSSTFENYPDVAYDARRDRFLVASYHIGGGGQDVVGRLIDASGAPIGEVIPIAASPEFEGGDGIGVGYSRAADAYVVAYQATTTEIWASIVGGDGLPGARIEATSGSRTGSYTPRLAGDDAAPRWLLVASQDFDRIGAQILEAPAVIEPDAGVALDASIAPDAGALDAAIAIDGAADAGRSRAVVSGCGCRAAPRARGGVIVLVLAALIWIRRSRAMRAVALLIGGCSTPLPMPIDAGLDGGPPPDVWTGLCDEPDRECPALVPGIGGACVTGLTCSYPDPGFERDATCVGGEWTITLRCPSGCPFPISERCADPSRDPLPGAALEIGPPGEPRPFRDGELVELVVGPQGYPMLPFAVRLTADGPVPDCIELAGESGTFPLMRFVRLRCGGTRTNYAILPGAGCDPAGIPIDLRVEAVGIAEETAHLRYVHTGCP